MTEEGKKKDKKEKEKVDLPSFPLASRNLAKALTHPVRQQILFLLVTPPPVKTEEDKAKAKKGEWGPVPKSPNGMSQELDEPLGNVSYHVKALRDLDLVQLVTTEPRRGAVEHFYGPTEETRMRLAAMASIGPELGAQEGDEADAE